MNCSQAFAKRSSSSFLSFLERRFCSIHWKTAMNGLSIEIIA